jgi:hypothetical protein
MVEDKVMSIAMYLSLIAIVFPRFIPYTSIEFACTLSPDKYGKNDLGSKL